MARFRKKPVEIEAVQFLYLDKIASDGGAVFAGSATHWLTEAMELPEQSDGSVFWDDEGLKIRTLEGVHLANPGDWVIRGVRGELYPCKPDIFAATYDPA